jgi:hypothetical protein
MWLFDACVTADYAGASLLTFVIPARRQLLWNVANASSPWAIVAILAAGIALLVGAVVICCGICAQMHKGSAVAPASDDNPSSHSINPVSNLQGAGAAVVNVDSMAALPVAVPVG